MTSSHPLILGIETSCDETAASVIRGDRAILSNVIFSHIAENAPYGGVVPEISSRAHIRQIDGIIARAMDDAGCAWNELDAVAVTAGPGLIGGVIVGVMTAKAIAAVTGKPLIAVNHLEGHALTARLTDDIPFPYLLLLVSGGHSQFIIVEGVGKYTVLGGTLDDALGECFDKVAKMLGLPYPGGPEVEKQAANGDASVFNFTVPMKGRAGCDLSFSGLKTAVRQVIPPPAGGRLGGGHVGRDISTHAPSPTLPLWGREYSTWVSNLCASFQYTATESLADRLRHAIEIYKTRCPEARHVVIAGGVAANRYIYGRLSEIAMEYELALTTPPVKLCTDNAAMIAWAGLERFRLDMTDPLDIDPRANWPLENYS